MLRMFAPRLVRPLASICLGLGLLLGSSGPLQIGDPRPDAGRPVTTAVLPGLAADLRQIFAPRPMAGAEALRLATGAPVWASFQSAAPRAVAMASAPAPVVPEASPLLPAIRAEAPGSGLVAALPALRSVRLAGHRPTMRVAARIAPRPARITLAAREADRGAAVQRIFGPQSVSGPALAYATLPTDPTRTVPDERPLDPAPAAPAAGGIAVYDISARTVTLPSGERLEAHSGLGPALDDPRYVHLRMRGATPPGTYDLTMREAPFHGVRALRLNPVGGAGAVHGRAGLLAHTFMLGPNGDSNGCISFRNYERFLQAFLRGEIRQVVVVAGEPSGFQGLARRIFGMGREPSARTPGA